MTATNHVLTGALIATAVHNPWLALPAAFLSHFVVDAIPHFGRTDIKLNSFYFRSRLLADMIVAALCLLIILLLQPAHVWIILLCGVLAASPDLMWLSRFIAANQHRPAAKLGLIRQFHHKIQWFEHPIGASVEVAWFLAMLVLLNAQLLIIR